MEVRSVSQGRQVSTNINNDKSTTTSGDLTNVSQAIGRNTQNQNNNVDQQNENVKINEKKIDEALEKLKNFIEDDNTQIEYQYHNKFNNDLMIKIVNKVTKEVILEVPPKKILDLVAKMLEMVGVFFDKKA